MRVPLVYYLVKVCFREEQTLCAAINLALKVKGQRSRSRSNVTEME